MLEEPGVVLPAEKDPILKLPIVSLSRTRTSARTARVQIVGYTLDLNTWKNKRYLFDRIIHNNTHSCYTNIMGLTRYNIASCTKFGKFTMCVFLSCPFNRISFGYVNMKKFEYYYSYNIVIVKFEEFMKLIYLHSASQHFLPLETVSEFHLPFLIFGTIITSSANKYIKYHIYIISVN